MRGVLDAIPRKTWLTGLVAWLGIFLVAVAWAMATPLSGSPDEPAHIIKAASVVRGEFLGTPVAGRPGFTKVTVPQGVGSAWSWTCFAYHDDVTARCQPAFVTSDKEISAVTSAGLYNPVYYALVGWPSLLTPNPQIAVYSMRILSALLTSFFFAVAFCALLLFRRPGIAGFTILAVLTPTTVFLSGAVNPNSLEIAAGAALLAVLLLLVRGPHVRHLGWALALVAASGVLLANARGLSPLWMAMIAVVAIIAAAPGRLGALLRLRAVWITLGVLVVGVGFALWWILRTNTLSSMGTFAGAGTTSPLTAFFSMVLDRSLDPGIIALFGWLDTYAPAIVYVLWSFLALGLTLAAVITARGRMLISLLVAIAGFFLIPAVVQAASVRQTGYIWQGRYTLVAYACALIASCVALATSERALPEVPARLVRRGILTIGAAVTLVGAYALYGAIKRYAVGADGSLAQFVRHSMWAPPGGHYLWILVCAIGFAVLSLVWYAWGSPTPSLQTERSSELTDSPEYQAAAR
jgi:Predicted membrane protein (DUF2142)